MGIAFNFFKAGKSCFVIYKFDVTDLGDEGNGHVKHYYLP